MKFFSSLFIFVSHEVGTEMHKMEQSLSRFVTPVEVGKCAKEQTISLEA
jgi:hypothetical protein